MPTKKTLTSEQELSADELITLYYLLSPNDTLNASLTFKALKETFESFRFTTHNDFFVFLMFVHYFLSLKDKKVKSKNNDQSQLVIICKLIEEVINTSRQVGTSQTYSAKNSHTVKEIWYNYAQCFLHGNSSDFYTPNQHTTSYDNANGEISGLGGAKDGCENEEKQDVLKTARSLFTTHQRKRLASVILKSLSSNKDTSGELLKKIYQLNEEENLKTKTEKNVPLPASQVSRGDLFTLKDVKFPMGGSENYPLADNYSTVYDYHGIAVNLLRHRETPQFILSSLAEKHWPVFVKILGPVEITNVRNSTTKQILSTPFVPQTTCVMELEILSQINSLPLNSQKVYRKKLHKTLNKLYVEKMKLFVSTFFRAELKPWRKSPKHWVRVCEYNSNNDKIRVIEKAIELLEDEKNNDNNIG